MTPRAVLRCDADAATGGGHVMRCLVLADALRERGVTSTFLVSPATPAAAPALAAAGHAVVDVQGDGDPAVLRDAAAGGHLALVYDRYGGDPAPLLATGAVRVLVTFADGGYWVRRPANDAHVVVAADGTPAPAAHPHWLGGPRFAPMRASLAARRGPAGGRDRRAPVARILVFFGMADGADGCGATLDVLHGLDMAVRIDVVAGPAARHLEALRARADRDRRVRLVLAPPDFDDLLAQADLAIGAGGVAAFERAMLGVPSIVFEAAENQRAGLALLSAAGAVHDGGTVRDIPVTLPDALRQLLADPERRLRLSQAGLAAVDGQGGDRIAAVIARALA